MTIIFQDIFELLKENISLEFLKFTLRFFSVNDTLHDYYTLDAEALKFSTTRKVQNIAEEVCFLFLFWRNLSFQARRLRPKMEAVKNLLDKSENGSFFMKYIN